MSEFHETGRGGQCRNADKAREKLPTASRPEGEAADPQIRDDESSNVLPAASPHAETLYALKHHHRRRNFAMEQRKRADLALGAYLRMHFGWHAGLPAGERSAITRRASALIKDGERMAKTGEVPDDPEFDLLEDMIAAALQARAPFAAVEKSAEKEMARLAKSLPVWTDFAEGVRGLGAISLAVILAETGDLSDYPKKGHVWKRLGLAVINGVRQGGLRKTASAEEWIVHGYNRQRRSRIFVIGDVLIKQGDLYRQVYLDRKEYERRAAEALGLIVAPAAKIPAKDRALYVSDGHIHRRAQRYMEKRLIRDLWQAWNGRRVTNLEVPKRPVSPCHAPAAPEAA